MECIFESIHLKVPSQWRNLPSLALPDGSHNWSDDTVYFHLPALHDPRKTVFGISCYRQVDIFELTMFRDLKFEVQIDAEKVRNKTEDITRGTVQKSVCVLSRLPLYGQIQVANFFQILEWQCKRFIFSQGENVSHHSSIF